MSKPSPATRRQVERLRDALTVAGESTEAQALTAILNEGAGSAQIAPSRLVQSTSLGVLETLRPTTLVPVDRESAQPLADVLFQDRLPLRPPIISDDLQQVVAALVEDWRNADKLDALGLPVSRSLLIYGAPGTGKTQLALWLAGQLGVPVILARIDGLISSFLGTTARNIGTLFNFASRYSCVLLLDEFDAIAKLRDDPQEVGEIKRVVNALIQNMDSRRSTGFTIGITNHERLLDNAIWRRFEAQLEMPKPDLPTRIGIAKRSFGERNPGEAALGLVAWLTEGLTGAEVEVLSGSVRKRMALSNELSFWDAMRTSIPLHAGRIREDRRAIVNFGPEEVSLHLSRAPELSYDQADIGAVFGRDRTTINRWIRAAKRSKS